MRRCVAPARLMAALFAANLGGAVFHRGADGAAATHQGEGGLGGPSGARYDDWRNACQISRVSTRAWDSLRHV